MNNQKILDNQFTIGETLYSVFVQDGFNGQQMANVYKGDERKSPIVGTTFGKMASFKNDIMQWAKKCIEKNFPESKQPLNKTLHTAGEWYAKDGQIYPIETGKTIAFVYPTETSEADAKLMAASKYMLTALQAIEARINGDFDNPALLTYGELSDSESGDIEGYCSDAIRKATNI